jgi:hypothetical protein
MEIDELDLDADRAQPHLLSDGLQISQSRGTQSPLDGGL